ncbi:unnamed protein product [Heligmosomoides polygyrus]|uniref:Hexosyltransferase n=1 Tax=Heligmosomoides polygyrus TaxID=6339 RepID=A0A3P8CNG1_HELPZ|nr:unnamed protein product [Heligmosomoides polygyrus]
MDSLLLLCRVDTFLVRGSGMFMHSVCVDVSVTVRIVTVSARPKACTRLRRHRTERDEKTPPLHATYDSGEELFLGTCDSRGVGGVRVLVNTHLAMNIESYESLTTRIGRLRLKRCGSVPALTVFVAYAPTSDYDDEEVEAFYKTDDYACTYRLRGLLHKFMTSPSSLKLVFYLVFYYSLLRMSARHYEALLEDIYYKDDKCSPCVRMLYGLNFTSPSIHEDTKVIVVVCTKPNDFRVRNTIRRTWASPHHSNAIQETFQEKIFTVMFLLGAGYLTGPIKQEMSTYKDILQVDVEDSYSNLIYKMLAVYRWIAANHPDKYVLKVDSDVVVLLDKVKEIVSDPTERSIKCLVNHHAPVQRNISHRWYIPESAYSKHYLPDYCNGPLYLMTPAALKSVLDVILNAKVRKQFFEVEDAFFTGVLAEIAGVRVQNQRGIWDRQVCLLGGYRLSSKHIKENR